MQQSLHSIFSVIKPVIGCIHLQPLPGAPGYSGDFQSVISKAINESQMYEQAGVHGLIVENFNDVPFYPDTVPPETIAAMAVVTREIVNSTRLPTGVNILRNDARAAIAVATVTGSQFIRVNVHMGAMVTDQGLIQGQAHHSARLRSALYSKVAIFADVAVKHAAPLAERSLELEVLDLIERGMADAIVVTGDRTGGVTSIERIRRVRAASSLPVLAGSGVTAEQLPALLPLVDGLIIGSIFKEDGRATNPLNEQRIAGFMNAWRQAL
ncbi:BtpA/SgcQ family protein [bacterium]|nr:BtpA/SgcQ family protein [candidate division CSSED10-310 bacterium]